MLQIIALAIFAGCTPSSPEPAAAPAVTTAPAKPARKPGQNMVLDVALGSPDHTTLVAAVQAAGLADALGSPGGVYTVFAPTNAAFDKLPPGTVETLLKPENKAKLKAILQHHAAVPILQQADMKDGEVIGMSDGTKATLHVQGDEIRFEGAKILASVPAVNGIVYVVDEVVLPPAKI